MASVKRHQLVEIHSAPAVNYVQPGVLCCEEYRKRIRLHLYKIRRLKFITFEFLCISKLN